MVDFLREFEVGDFYQQGLSKSYINAGYEYNGGMHLVNYAFAYGSYLGVVFIGSLLGMIIRIAERPFDSKNWASWNGFLPLFSICFMLLIANTFWYNPIALFKLSVATLLFAMFLRCLPKKVLV